MTRVLLVEPDFPYPRKSKRRANGIHKNFIPIGLLKLGAYHLSLGHKVKLVRGTKGSEALKGFKPDHILVTSLFTYWSKSVWSTIEHYRNLFPHSQIVLGGIYATLHHQQVYFRTLAKAYDVKVHVGLYKKAEGFYPDYSLLTTAIDHHVTHAMRGCIRKCSFCGTWKLEPVKKDKSAADIAAELKAMGKNQVVFFDNNFLANKNIKDILQKLSKLSINDRAVFFECQSGLDGRLLERDKELTVLLRKAHFKNIKIAWDNSLDDAESLKRQIGYLVDAGYKEKDLSVFMIYNFNVSYEQMLEKLAYCKEWGVQINDCRYRPLDITKDNYRPRRPQNSSQDIYYIHSKGGWTDEKIKDFRQRVREHNIWIRYAKEKGREYNVKLERWGEIRSIFKFFGLEPLRIEQIEDETWKKRFNVMKRVYHYYRKTKKMHPVLKIDDLCRLDEMLTNLVGKLDAEKSKREKERKAKVSKGRKVRTDAI